MIANTLQILLTGGTSAIAFAIIAFVARDERTSLAARILVALATSVGLGYLSPLPQGTELPLTVSAITRVAGIPATGLAWWFAWSLLDDRFRIGVWQWLGLLLAAMFPSYYALIDFGVAIPRLPNSLSEIGLIPPLAICAHLVWLALGGLRDDLVQRRRRARVWIAVLLALALAAVLVSEELSREAGGLLRAATSFMAAFLILLWLVRIAPETIAFAEPRASEPKREPSIDPRDALAFERLRKAMTEERIYLKPELTIGDLAKRVGVPEHQMRVLINRGLGARNFSTYVAKARVDHAKAALADPAKARIAIGDIAMDAGFPSLATFNRAFKVIEGITPSDFRRRSLEQIATASPQI
jgi:AraC-like DNA-binding protein